MLAKVRLRGLVKEMTAAAFQELGDRWPSARRFAKAEFQKLGETLLAIQGAKAAGEITGTEARLLLEMQKNAMRSVLVTVEGLGILAAERSINAGLAVARDTVNRALGWPLL